MYGGPGSDTFEVDGLSGWDSFTGGDDFGTTDAIELYAVNSWAYWGQIKINYLSGIERIVNFQSAKAVDILASGALDLSSVDVVGIRQIVGCSGNNVITGTSKADNIDGGSGDDWLAGGLGNDIVAGGAGNDLLAGNADSDRLTGGLGNDALTGGAGADTFVFLANEGSDVIADFAHGEDIIDVSNTSASGIGDLTISANADGWAEIAIDGTTITAIGITVANIDATYFLF